MFPWQREFNYIFSDYVNLRTCLKCVRLGGRHTSSSSRQTNTWMVILMVYTPGVVPSGKLKLTAACNFDNPSLAIEWRFPFWSSRRVLDTSVNKCTYQEIKAMFSCCNVNKDDTNNRLYNLLPDVFHIWSGTYMPQNENYNKANELILLSEF